MFYTYSEPRGAAGLGQPSMRGQVAGRLLVLALLVGPAPAVALNLGGSGLGVGVDVSLGGGGIGVGVDVSTGSGGIGVDVGIGGSGGGSGGSGGGNGGGSGGGSGGGTGGGSGGGGAGGGGSGGGTGGGATGSDDDTPRAGAVVSRRAGGGGLACARDGNETAYNGFVVRAKDGERIGWVHAATVTPEGRIVALRLQSEGSACYRLSGAGLRIGSGEVWTSADRDAFR
ncbi:hypothetical protein [Tabrizicola aquatica]|uniref:hypothetical protein n=1 Tax=Tabrizicola aquatica TaxID=909926 RepID=UPI000CD03C05|nr:hypothetical protein [Tabrizicola aquatica]